MATSPALDTSRTSMLQQFIRYTGVGAIGTAFHYLTLITLVQLVAMNSVLASSIGFIGGAIINYTLNYYFTFQSNKKHHIATIKFFTVAGMGFLLNAIIMYWMINGFELHYIFAQVIATGTVLVCAFICNRLWTFG